MLYCSDNSNENTKYLLKLIYITNTYKKHKIQINKYVHFYNNINKKKQTWLRKNSPLINKSAQLSNNKSILNICFNVFFMLSIRSRKQINNNHLYNKYLYSCLLKESAQTNKFLPITHMYKHMLIIVFSDLQYLSPLQYSTITTNANICL